MLLGNTIHKRKSLSRVLLALEPLTNYNGSRPGRRIGQRWEPTRAPTQGPRPKDAQAPVGVSFSFSLRDWHPGNKSFGTKSRTNNPLTHPQILAANPLFRHIQLATISDYERSKISSVNSASLWFISFLPSSRSKSRTNNSCWQYTAHCQPPPAWCRRNFPCWGRPGCRPGPARR